MSQYPLNSMQINMSVASSWPAYVIRNTGFQCCNSVINNVKLETSEDDPLRVKTYSVNQINKEFFCWRNFYY
jgi:hypothetical protein